MLWDAMRRPWISITAFVIAVFAFSGTIALAFAYENLRRQMAGISSDMARLPNPSANHEHYEVRLGVIRSQLSRVEKPIIVMGDSIVESALLPPSLCGHPVINAGIGGATIGFFTRYASVIEGETKPALVVLSVGINDAGNTLENFRAAYLATLQSIDGPVAIVTIASAQKSVSGFNRFIRGLDGPSLIESKELHDDMTTDGIHPNQIGYKLWNKAITQGIEAALGCSG